MTSPKQSAARPIHTDLPAPTAGMLAAKRPTGIVMGLVISIVAVSSLTVASTIAAIPLIVESVANGTTVDPAALAQFNPLNLLAFAVIVLVLWIWLKFKERRPFASLGFDRRPAGRPAGILAARGFGIGIAMMIICVFVPVATGQADITWASPNSSAVATIGIVLVGFVVQGSTEEILTRGYITQVVARRWGLVAAVIVQAVFFTLMHGFNPGMGVLPLVNLMLFAVFASFMSLRDASLWGVCALHGAWNWAQGSVFGVAVSGGDVPDTFFSFVANPGSSDLITGGRFGIEGSLVTTAVYGIGILMFWQMLRQQKAAAAAETRPDPHVAEPAAQR